MVPGYIGYISYIIWKKTVSGHTLFKITNISLLLEALSMCQCKIKFQFTSKSTNNTAT